MPVRQSAWLTERQDESKAEDRRVLARTQFGKRLLILSDMKASGIIPAEEDDVDIYLEKGPARIPRPPQGCWTRKRRRMRIG